MSADDAFLREHLSPKALEVLTEANRIRAVAARLTEGVDAVKEEAFSEADLVWACADGQGFIRALAIEDEALTYPIEDLEDLISDCLVDASARGQAAGELWLSSLAADVDGGPPPAP